MFADTITVLKAYHEAGHAVVGHAIGRCIESVALLSGEDGYGGYCRFSAFMEDANGHPEWNEKSANPDLITIYYAGMLSTAYYCSLYLALDEEEDSVRYPEGSEREDLERIKEILSQMNIDQQQREAITDTCWTQAQTILSDYSIAVDKVTAVLVKRGSLTGYAAHRLIWQAVGYPENDWRFVALGIKKK
ncbi:hypothetical protein [Ktedonobacter racemifer]|uniref:Peptidase M41 n=1 Tax=Ktedonobacter racemifer DSM 44963 TaxID=485913 RepID=D6TCY9_KTERA|nr:hypothetical protein [Ktedonobacter racemifer]EFH90040.1 hypothetical protein Krac_11637 [Ktedonobacter racemifer DSM 44963]